MTLHLKPSVLLFAFLFGLALGALLFESQTAHAQAPALLQTFADITGDGNVHQLAASGLAGYVQFSTPVTGNTGVCRIGESMAAVTSSRGFTVPPNAGRQLPPLGKPYALNQIFYMCASSDVMTIGVAF